MAEMLCGEVQAGTSTSVAPVNGVAVSPEREYNSVCLSRNLHFRMFLCLQDRLS